MNKQQLQELCKRLKSNDPQLFAINLEYENLGIEGATLLAEALHQNRIVDLVSIQLSNIGFAGTKKLVEALTGRGIRTHLQVHDDYSEEEYNTLLQMKPKASRSEKKAEARQTSQPSRTSSAQKNNQPQLEK